MQGLSSFLIFLKTLVLMVVDILFSLSLSLFFFLVLHDVFITFSFSGEQQVLSISLYELFIAVGSLAVEHRLSVYVLYLQ